MVVKKTGRKLQPMWLFGLLALLGIGGFLYSVLGPLSVFGPSPAIILSKETTFILEPLAADGLPDYLAFLRQKMQQGVTAENNAVALISQVINIRHVPPKDRQTFFSELGVSPPAPDSKLFLQLDKDLQYQFLKAHYRAWKNEQCPSLASWLNTHLPVLDVAAEAAQRDRFYSPLIAEPTSADSSSPIMSVFLETEVATSKLANALCMRSMRHLGEGRLQSSRKDIFSVFKLARLLADDAPLICSLRLNFQCNTYANKALRAVLADSQLTLGEAQSIQRELQGVPPWSTIAEALKTYERFVILDAILHMKRYGVGPHTGYEGWSWDDLVPTDYNIALRDCNDWFDKLDALVALKDRRARKNAWETFFLELDQISARAMKEKTSKQARRDLTRRSQVISNIIVCLLLPDISVALDAQDRANTELRLTRLAAALAVYRTEQGTYPEQLNELVPGVILKLPVDLYSGKSFLYERKDDGGYLLYSVFENGADDGGSDFEGEIVNGEWVEGEEVELTNDQTDLVIRVPEPGFRLPVGE